MGIIRRRRCDECGKERKDVKRQADPFDGGLTEPGDAPWMRNLCEPCALARFEQS